MSNHAKCKNSHNKSVVYILILLIIIQACGSSKVITFKAESNTTTIEEIRVLEEQGKGPNIVVLVEKNEKKKVKQLNKVSQDSVFFEMKNEKIAGYKIEEMKAYHIYKKSRIPVFGMALFTASALYGLDTFNSADSYAQNNISFNVAIASFYGRLIVAALAGVTSLVVMATEFNATSHTAIYFTQTPDGINILTSNSDTLGFNSKAQKRKE